MHAGVETLEGKLAVEFISFNIIKLGKNFKLYGKGFP